MSNELENSGTLIPDGTQESKEATQPDFNPYHPFEASAEPPRAPEPPYAGGGQPIITPTPTQPPARVRRVGTLTMGAALIVSGVVALISLFYPSFDFVLAAKLSPLVLIFIGVEILYHNFFHRNDKLKYDFLSTFVCFLLICTSVTVAMLPPIYEQFGPPRNAAQHRIEMEIQDAFLVSLSGMPISSLDTTVYLNRPIKEDYPLTYNDLIPSDYLYIQIELAGSYTDKTQFAKDCKAILDKITANAIPYDRIAFQHEIVDKQTSYWLEVNDKFRAGLSAEQLAQVVDDNRINQEIEQAYEELDRQRQQQNEDIERQREEISSEMERQREEISSEMERQRGELEAQRQQQTEDIQRQREEFNAEVDRRNAELNRAS